MPTLQDNYGRARRALTAALRRREAEKSLIAFAQLTHPDYRPNWHHRLLAQKLEDVAAGRCRRLVVSMPPRNGKSELATVRFAPWLFARRSRCSVALATYSADFADEMGRKARSVLDLPVYRELWPNARLAADSRAVAHWETANGCHYYAVGVGGPLTGRGADVLVVDDPHKNLEEARSKVVRDAVFDWYTSTAHTRLEKDGAVVVIATRWHESDLIGRLLLEGGEAWEVLSLPAIAERADEYRAVGDALWPERYSLEALASIRATLGEQQWASLYQQRPAPLEGALFKPDAITVIEAEPADVKKWVRAWDLGATAQGDPTAGVRMGEWGARRVVADVVRLQGSPDQVERAILAAASRDGVGCEIHLPQDPGQSGKAQIQYLTSRLAGYNVKSSPETGSKVTRAEPYASQCNVGNVALVRAPWNRAYIEELRVFPNGAHDDQVDASSRAFAALVKGDCSWFGLPIEAVASLGRGPASQFPIAPRRGGGGLM
jgi:predicted phage terminase large subunit-like protein